MPPRVHRLGGLPHALEGEQISTLADGQCFRLEHICSGDHSSPPDFWYDQTASEWAILLRGTAELEFADGVVALAAGDAMVIPARMRHRVVRSTGAVWLALHFVQQEAD